MHSIQMVDLHSQYLKLKPEIDQAIQNVITDSAFISGKYVTEFETSLKKYLSIENVISCGNGTDALQLALMALNLKEGDEVILPAFSFVAPAEAAAFLKLIPVFADVDQTTFNITAETIEPLITNKTKAIIVVHLFGQMADMESIFELGKKYNLKIIEDVAQAFGAKYYFNNSWRPAGTLGDIGCTSFFPSKNLACFGDGGAVYTNNNDLARNIRMLANHGQPKKYTHELIGINSRLDGIQASILNVKLNKLEEYISARRKAAEYYNINLKNIDWIKIPGSSDNNIHTYNQYTILLSSKINRNHLINYLKERQIPSVVYYNNLIKNQLAYQNFKTQSLANSEYLSSHVLSLPMHTELTEAQLKHICKTLKSYND